MKNRGSLLTVKTKLQGHLLWLVFCSMAVPTLVLGGVVLVLLGYPFELHAGAAPEATRARVLLALCVAAPVVFIGLLSWAFLLTNRIVGPVERMIRELDARLLGTASGPINLRPKDLLLPLVEKINLLLAEWERSKKDGGV
ncbi:MAG TPA: hypothetical protein PK322_14070 [Opitutaceae bacterium]|nr:hypothetical protein [Opitutaceae bacterium]